MRERCLPILVPFCQLNTPQNPSTCILYSQSSSHMQHRPSTAHTPHNFCIQDTCNTVAMNTHFLCTTCANTHPPLLTPQLSMFKKILLGTQVTNTKVWLAKWHILWCHSYLVWLIFEDFIRTCICFHSENLFCDFQC